MKTIEEASVEYSKEQYDHDPCMRFQCETHFEAGIEFAQRFYPIERDKDGFTTLEQDEEFQKNFPILVKGNYGIELLDELTTVLEKPGHGYTHWRPVNLK